MVRVVERVELSGSAQAARFEGAAFGSGVSFFVVDLAAGQGPVLHRHPYEETFVILEGSATFTVDGQAIDAAAETIIVVPAGAAHKFVAGPAGVRSVNVHPRDRMIQEDLEPS
jgi:quercetin dioxygenase-like cupin family protein